MTTKRTSGEPAYVEAQRLAEERRARERIAGIVRTEMVPNIDGDDEPTPVTQPTPRRAPGEQSAVEGIREYVRHLTANSPIGDANANAILELHDRLSLVERILAPCTGGPANCPGYAHEWRIDNGHPRCRLCGVEVPR